MSKLEEKISSDEELRQALVTAQDEVRSVRHEMEDLLSRQKALQKSHEEALLQVRQESNKEVLKTALRAEAIRLGAHNPDDVVRLIDTSHVRREDDGSLVGVNEVLEQARRDRAYLFGEPTRSGAVWGTTIVPNAPQPGGLEPFDARAASQRDYETRKWQFLGQNK